MQQTSRVGRSISSAALALGLALLVAVGLLPAADAGEQIRAFTTRLITEDSTKRQAAIAWSQEQFAANQRADHVVLGRDDVFADALSSGAVQCAVDGPLLLSERTRLSSDVRAELERLGPTRVSLLGGTAALSEEVARELVDEGYDIRRLVGQTRIETAIEAARASYPSAQSVILARAFGGEDDTQAFADAIAAGAAACVQEAPILLTESSTLSESVRHYLETSDIKTVYLAGGQAAIADSVVSELRTLGIEVTRYGGANRAATAVRITEGLIEGGKLGGGAKLAGADDVPCIVLVDGYQDDSWASGFAAARYVAVNGCGLVLSNGGELPPETIAYLADVRPDQDVPLVCGPFVDLAACEQAADILGHTLATVVLTKANAQPGGTLEGTITGEFDTATVSGCGFPPGTPVEPDPQTGDFTVTVPQGTTPGDDTLTFTITYADGFTSTQTFTCTVEAAPPPPSPPPPSEPSLLLTPAQDLGPARANTHTVTATVSSPNGTALSGTEVRFEVYRPSSEGYFLVAGGDGLTDANGASAFTYGAPTFGAQDIIVACIDQSGAVFDGNAYCADATVAPPALRSDRTGDTATMLWFDNLDLRPDCEPTLENCPTDGPVNGQAYAMTATVLGPGGQPIAGWPVRFEVYVPNSDLFYALEPAHTAQDLTDAAGVANFAYTNSGSARRDDVVVACAVQEGDAPTAEEQYCGFVDGQGMVVRNFDYVGDDEHVLWPGEPVL